MDDKPPPYSVNNSGSFSRSKASSSAHDARKGSVLDNIKQTDPETIGKLLWQSIDRKDMTSVQLLLEAGANVNKPPRFQKPFLMLAIDQKNPELLRMLLKKKPNLETTYAGTSALYQAVRKGESELVALLLGAGANVKVTSRFAPPVLWSAASRRRFEIVKLLVDAGANVDRTCSRVLSNSLYDAVKKGDLPLVRLLLDSKADIEKKSYGDMSALYLAVSNGNWNAVELLLKYGADVNVTCRGRPALFQAVSKGNRNIVKSLLENGADVNAKSPRGFTPVEKAAYDGNHDLLRLLLGQG